MTIREIRQAAGMTQQEFAACTGIPKRTIENWEEGSRNPPEYLTKMIDAYLLVLRKRKEGYLMYKIREVETNVTYDDLYETVADAEAQISEYEKDDGDERTVRYIVIDADEGCPV